MNCWSMQQSNCNRSLVWPSLARQRKKWVWFPLSLTDTPAGYCDTAGQPWHCRKNEPSLCAALVPVLHSRNLTRCIVRSIQYKEESMNWWRAYTEPSNYWHKDGYYTRYGKEIVKELRSSITMTINKDTLSTWGKKLPPRFRWEI